MYKKLFVKPPGYFLKKKNFASPIKKNLNVYFRINQCMSRNRPVIACCAAIASVLFKVNIDLTQQYSGPTDLIY